jgi:hypothetical protein
MRTITSESVKKSLERNRVASLHLINMLPPRHRAYWRDQLFGSPTDKIAEVVMAHMMKGIATDSDGYDILVKDVKLEVKFSFIDNSLCKKGYKRRQASIRNLKSKNCDLIIVCVDPDVPSTDSNYMNIFHLPVDVWKRYWKKNGGSMNFGCRKTWYKEYKVNG